MIAYKAPQRDLEARPVRPLDIEDLHTGAETAAQPASSYKMSSGFEKFH